MPIRTIRTYPDPVLKQKAAPLTRFGKEEQKLFDDMIETMFFADGVGLAAPQIGVSQRIMVVTPDGKRGHEIVMANPVVIKKSGTQRSEEGCLSLPGIMVEIIRSATITLHYQDRLGKKQAIEAKELLSRAIQHEIDHLDGVLIMDRVEFGKRQELLDQYQHSPKLPQKTTQKK